MRSLTAEDRRLTSSAAAVAAAAKQQQQQQQQQHEEAAAAAAATLWGELEAFGLPLLAVDFAQLPPSAVAAASAAAAATAALGGPSSDARSWSLGRVPLGGAHRGLPSPAAGVETPAESQLLLQGTPRGLGPHMPVVDLMSLEGPPLQQWLPLSLEGPQGPPHTKRGLLTSLRRLLLRLLQPTKQRQQQQSAAAAAATVAALQQLRSSTGWSRGPWGASPAFSPESKGPSSKPPEPLGEGPFLGGPLQQQGPLMFAEGSWSLARDILLLIGRGCSFFVIGDFAPAMQQQQQQLLLLLQQVPPLQQQGTRGSRLQQLRSRSSSSSKLQQQQQRQQQQQLLLDAWGFPQWPTYGILAHIHHVLGKP